ncbi:MAG: iron-sulfur cluster repair di-iron protein [Actinomycetia bacterium]|nr:iron-sulfur cluster repair di-iron protein [Actinomycetes bacterium]MCP4086440.1 iron-sulfur cluster repair di-iron protein [Actinomycetes bacterium]
MSAIDPNTTLAELVTIRPELAARLDDLSLDYCCGGQRTLGAAIAEAGINLDTTIATLQDTPASHQTSEWDGMEGLVDHLEKTHHVYLRETLPRLVALSDKVAGVHGQNHRELAGVAALVGELRADLEPHLLKEEQVLFPMIRELAAAGTSPSFHCGNLSNPIGVMTVEHDSVGALLSQLRSCTDGYRVPDDGCASYRALYEGLAELEADTHLHVHKENNLLFPAVFEAEQALIAQDQ